VREKELGIRILKGQNSNIRRFDVTAKLESWLWSLDFRRESRRRKQQFAITWKIINRRLGDASGD
jgi:hypothetical protein